MRLGWTEILIILAVVLVFFGGKRLPELGKALGKSLRGFKEGVEGKGGGDSEGNATSEGDKPPADGAALRSSEQPPPSGTSSIGGTGADSGHGSGVTGN